MYRYFIGNHSNLAYRESNQPIVVRVENPAKIVIEKWLENYHLDFDNLILSIVAVTKKEILNIAWEDTQNLVITLYHKTNKLAYVELLNEPRARIKVQIDNDEYSMDVQECMLLECYQQYHHIRTVFQLLKKRICLNHKQTLVILECEHMDWELYQGVKKSVDKVENWENLVELALWVKNLPVLIENYDITIIYYGDIPANIHRLQYVQHQVENYFLMNGEAEYLVEKSGNWSVEIGGHVFEHYEKLKKNRIVASFDERIRGYYERQFIHVKQTADLMLKTMDLINASLMKS